MRSPAASRAIVATALCLAMYPGTSSGVDLRQSPAGVICRAALGTSGANWDVSAAFAPWREEAIRRGYTPQYCTGVIAGTIPATPTPPPSPAQALPPAQADPLVASIQTLLSVLGYDPGPPDGFVGPKTTQAISQFQGRIGLRADGRPTEALRTSLQAAATGSRPSTTPAPPVTAYDDTEGQLRVRQAANAVALASRELESARGALDAERRRVVQTNEERDLNREMIQTLQRNVVAAETKLRLQETALREAQEQRRAGLAGSRQ